VVGFPQYSRCKAQTRTSAVGSAAQLVTGWPLHFGCDGELASSVNPPRHPGPRLAPTSRANDPAKSLDHHQRRPPISSARSRSTARFRRPTRLANLPQPTDRPTTNLLTSYRQLVNRKLARYPSSSSCRRLLCRVTSRADI